MLRELIDRFFRFGRAPAPRAPLSTVAEKAADRLIAAGNQAENEGRLQQACDQYRSAVGTAPRYAPAHLNLGIGLEALGDADGAIKSYEAALAIDPGNPYAGYNLGKLLYALGALQRAEQVLRSALEHKPEFPEASVVLSNVYGSQGNLAEAAAALDAALKQRPDWPGALYNYAIVLRKLGRLAEAESAMRRGVAADPANADAVQTLGNILVQQGRLDDAMACYEKALALNPDLPDTLINLGNILSDQGRTDEAAARYRRALALNPNLAEAHSGLGNVMRSLNRYEEAIDCYERALAIKPEFMEAHYNLGTALYMTERHEEAARCHERALTLKPDYAEAHNNLGAVLWALNRHAEAINCYERALTLKPDYMGAYYNIGTALHDLDRHLEAIAYFGRALAIKPDYLSIELFYIYLNAQQALWHLEREQDLLARFRSYGDRGHINPFLFLFFVESAAVQKEIARLYAGSFQPADNTPVPLRSPAPSGDHRLRVAYFSCDFHSHDTSYLMAELFELHDPARFDVTLFSYGKDDGSIMRKRIAAFPGFVDLQGLRPDTMREQIQARQPDILVDLKGYTAGTLSKLLAQRMAPLQVNWLGYPGTMGADFIDYIIADPFVIPEGAEDFYSEKIVRLPDCYQPNDRKRLVATPQTRAAYGLPETGLVFCSFNQVAKIRPDIFDIWLEVLDEVKDSVLWINAGPQAERNFKRIAVERGVDSGRLIVAPTLPLAEHLARYQVADLALDTYPCGSHTTASDALWAGCSIVALVGETFASRVSGSLLHAVGLSELITSDREGYKRLILRLAQSETYRNEVRARLKRNRDTAPLFDTPRFVRNLERAYEAMMERARAGLPPAHIRL